jgi:cytoskeleton protein RodZ
MIGEQDTVQASLGASAAGMTAGQKLRQAREQAGLHLASLAAVLKVPPQRLEALEADRYDQMPGMAFVRGLAASFARTLKLDVDEVLALLPKTEASALRYDHSVGAVSTRRSVPVHGATFGGRRGWPRWLAALVVVLLLAAAGILFWPQLSTWLGSAESQAEAAVEQDSAQGALEPAAAPARDAAELAAPAAAGSLTLTPLAPAQPQAGDPQSATEGSGLVSPPLGSLTTLAAAGAGDSAVAAQAQAALAPLDQSGATLTTTNLSPSGVMATPSSGTLVFVVKGESWIEVTDGNKLPLLRRTLQAGERVGVSGTEPLSVIVGHAENVEVQLRGQPYDLKQHKRGNVARFQVK